VRLEDESNADHHGIDYLFVEYMRLQAPLEHQLILQNMGFPLQFLKLKYQKVDWYKNLGFLNLYLNYKLKSHIPALLVEIHLIQIQTLIFDLQPL